ncbi:tripartite tricarboxylate transporter substrate binding protein [Roseococcus sp. SYP-B2431]|uniref:Bug family tripartite tricarboxylate transporter substrate binding protein n=1 Tax=Roseococcus sp. SYP-B2431 TaxID=2496640 RepID=UPI00103A0E2D|nr:tripartite tricarboxylate transporter substrate-binding protein [Roseococcus sp. SYP-B2431]TCH98812.1 tripartite tricarboxylate transporter substrate binding protein [Roseococcus sp. SYP-B2431]
MSAITRRSVLALAAGGLAAPALAQGAWNPTRPITLVVGFPQGGRTDLACRLIVPGLQAALGVPIEVDNRGGDAGNLGTEAVMSARHDGYTLLFGSVGPMAINPHTVEGMTLDPREMVPIGLVGQSSLLLCAHPTLGLNDLSGLRTWLAGRQGHPISYGSPGTGSLPHLAMELLRERLGGPPMTHIPCRGWAAAQQELLAGRTRLMFGTASAVTPALRARTLNALMASGFNRCPVVPQVATAQEQALPNFAFTTWIGLFAPRKTPAPIVARLNAALNAAMADTGLRGRVTSRGDEPGGGTPDQMARIMAADYELWGELVRANNIRADA